MKEISLDKFEFSPFNKIAKDWMLVSAGTPESCSTLTASWGGVGVLWGKNVVFSFIRPQRHTLEFIDQEDYFSITFLKDGYRDALNYCGSHSGGENQKITEAGLHLAEFKEAPIFKEASLTFICKKLYRQPLEPKYLLDQTLDERWYPNKDYHNMFVGEIVHVFSND